MAGGGKFVRDARRPIPRDRVVPVRVPAHDEPLVRLDLKYLPIDDPEAAVAHVGKRSAFFQLALKTRAVDVVFRHFAIDDPFQTLPTGAPI